MLPCFFSVKYSSRFFHCFISLEIVALSISSKQHGDNVIGSCLVVFEVVGGLVDGFHNKVFIIRFS